MGRVEGFDLEAAVNHVINDAVIPGMDETLDAMVNVAESVTPVRTGYLKSRWRTRPAKRVSRTHVVGAIENDAEYAVYVDKGTSRMRGRNMSGIALDAESPNLAGRIRSRL